MAESPMSWAEDLSSELTTFLLILVTSVVMYVAWLSTNMQDDLSIVDAHQLIEEQRATMLHQIVRSALVRRNQQARAVRTQTTQSHLELSPEASEDLQHVIDDILEQPGTVQRMPRNEQERIIRDMDRVDNATGSVSASTAQQQPQPANTQTPTFSFGRWNSTNLETNTLTFGANTQTPTLSFGRSNNTNLVTNTLTFSANTQTPPILFGRPNNTNRVANTLTFGANTQTAPLSFGRPNNSGSGANTQTPPLLFGRPNNTNRVANTLTFGPNTPFSRANNALINRATRRIPRLTFGRSNNTSTFGGNRQTPTLPFGPSNNTDLVASTLTVGGANTQTPTLSFGRSNSTDLVANTENCSNENCENGSVLDQTSASTSNGNAAPSTATPNTSNIIPSANVPPVDLGVEFRIKLKYLDDEIKLVKGAPHEKIGTFKNRHFQSELSNNKIVRLVFNGHVLQPDTKSLLDCGLFDNCAVHCLVHNKPTGFTTNQPTAPGRLTINGLQPRNTTVVTNTGIQNPVPELRNRRMLNLARFFPVLQKLIKFAFLGITIYLSFGLTQASVYYSFPGMGLLMCITLLGIYYVIHYYVENNNAQFFYFAVLMLILKLTMKLEFSYRYEFFHPLVMVLGLVLLLLMLIVIVQIVFQS